MNFVDFLFVLKWQKNQTYATLRSLHNSKYTLTRECNECKDLENELVKTQKNHLKINFLREQMTNQETRWKEAYDSLMAENESLRSFRGEALLATQWRTRYETCLSEKKKLEYGVNMENNNSLKGVNRESIDDTVEYETKYNDLKCSFKLYRKRAKEIFEAQQQDDITMLKLNDTKMEDSRLHT